MILKAKNKHNIDLELSWMIGDNETDIKAAHSSGITNTILVSKLNPIDKFNSNSNSNSNYIVESIKHIKKIILF